MENVAGVKKKSKRKEKSVWKAVWVRVQASLCEVAIGRRVAGFLVV